MFLGLAATACGGSFTAEIPEGGHPYEGDASSDVILPGIDGAIPEGGSGDSSDDIHHPRHDAGHDADSSLPPPEAGHDASCPQPTPATSPCGSVTIDAPSQYCVYNEITGIYSAMNGVPMACQCAATYNCTCLMGGLSDSTICGVGSTLLSCGPGDNDYPEFRCKTP